MLARVLLALILLTSAGPTAMPTASTPTSMSEAQPGWMDAWMDATVAIGKRVVEKVPGPGGITVEHAKFVGIGTGVIMGLPSDPTHTPWLVTAKHVFLDIGAKWEPQEVYLRFNWFAERSVDEYVGIRLPLVRGNERFWVSGGSGIDLACIAIALPVSEVGRNEAPVIPLTNFATADDLFQGAGVFALGFPATSDPHDPWSQVTRPLLRHGVISWVSPAAPERNLVVIDASVSEGNSGSPVFRVPTGVNRFGGFNLGGKVSFLGIVTKIKFQLVPLVQGGAVVPMEDASGKPNLVGRSLIGLGIVEPASRVQEMLEAAVAKRKSAGR